LQAYEAFLGSLIARSEYGEHVCCAQRPESVHGSQEALTEGAVPRAAHILDDWGQQLVAAMVGVRSEGDVLRMLESVARRFDLRRFADEVERQILHGAMLGMLDAEWEHENDVEIAPVTFAAPGKQTVGAPSFANIPFDAALRLFESKKLLPRPAFDALTDGAKRRAFTVAGLASEELLAVAHAELLRQLRASEETTYKDPETGKWVYKGTIFREFDQLVKKRLETAGWTPANASHVETVFRTNIASAYASGRYIENTRPAVIAAVPYWQIRAVGDDGTRPAHKRASGIVLPANHPFWTKAYPPFGHRCRCVVIARTQRWLDRNGGKIGPVPRGLPDPGFDSGTKSLIQVPAATLAEQPKAPTARPAVDTLPAEPAPAPAVRQPVREADFQESGALGKRKISPGGTVDEINAASRDIFGRDFDPNDFDDLLGVGNADEIESVMTRGRVVADLNRLTLTLKFGKRGENGELVREYSRTSEGVVAHHDLFIIPERLRASGLGSKVLQAQLTAYKRLGVRKVVTEAAWHGQYVWPNMGFRLRSPEALAPLKRGLKEWLRTNYQWANMDGSSSEQPLRAQLSPEAIDGEIDRIMTVQQLARLKVNGVPVGKHYLMARGAGDEGLLNLELDLTDGAQMADVDAYFARSARKRSARGGGGGASPSPGPGD
jgi:SPP1 gp7 family putative phage head morphogenesis protein